MGQKSASDGDTRLAKNWRNASYGLSIFGIIAGAIVIGFIVAYTIEFIAELQSFYQEYLNVYSGATTSEAPWGKHYL